MLTYEVGDVEDVVFDRMSTVDGEFERHLLFLDAFAADVLLLGLGFAPRRCGLRLESTTDLVVFQPDVRKGTYGAWFLRLWGTSRNIGMIFAVLRKIWKTVCI